MEAGIGGGEGGIAGNVTDVGDAVEVDDGETIQNGWEVLQWIVKCFEVRRTVDDDGNDADVDDGRLMVGIRG